MLLLRSAAASLLAIAALTALAAPAHAAPPTLFPSDALTVADPAQRTGKRLNLPLPDCGARPSDCDELRLLNELDGFDLDPRIEIGFGRPIDVARVTPDTVFLVPAAGGERIGLSRLVFSPARNVLYGQPARQLAEATADRLVVTAAVSGEGAEATFTTMSATEPLRQMRAQLDDGSAYDAAGIAPAARGLTVEQRFPSATVLNIQRVDDTGKALVGSAVPNSARAGAGTYAFGSFRSPSWLTADRRIPAAPTRTGAPRVTGAETVGFTLIRPSGAPPPGGFPVAIFGPGITRSKFDLFLAADENAQRGVATIAIDPVGHGFGPRSAISVNNGAPFPAHGRGRDLDGDGTITEQEGVRTPGQPAPFATIGLRDGLRQTALDNMALVRAIGRGVDADGDGAVDLRPDGVTYYAQSLGGIYGTMLMGVDPRVGAAALNVPGGPILEIARLSPAFRDVVTQELRNRRPGLLNGGRGGFTESQPLFVDPPVTAPAVGAVAIQEVAARTNWINRPGSPETFAPLIRDRRVIIQVAYGDETVVNPTSYTIADAGDLFHRVSLFRNDKATPELANPHGFLLQLDHPSALQGQTQVATFLRTGRTIDPDGAGPVWEVPIVDPSTLLELNFDFPAVRP